MKEVEFFISKLELSVSLSSCRQFLDFIAILIVGVVCASVRLLATFDHFNVLEIQMLEISEVTSEL